MTPSDLFTATVDTLANRSMPRVYDPPQRTFTKWMTGTPERHGAEWGDFDDEGRVHSMPDGWMNVPTLALDDRPADGWVYAHGAVHRTVDDRVGTWQLSSEYDGKTCRHVMRETHTIVVTNRGLCTLDFSGGRERPELHYIGPVERLFDHMDRVMEERLRRIADRARRVVVPGCSPTFCNAHISPPSCATSCPRPMAQTFGIVCAEVPEGAR